MAIHKGRPSARWWLAALTATVAVAGLTGYAGHRYQLRVDAQSTRCMPHARLFVVDTWDDHVSHGDLVAFRAPDLEPVIAAGTAMVKRVAATPGQRVEVTAEATRVDGAVVATGLDAASQMGTTASALERTSTVSANSVWVVAAGPKSIDSRYWGELPQRRVIGQAYVVF